MARKYLVTGGCCCAVLAVVVALGVPYWKQRKLRQTMMWAWMNATEPMWKESLWLRNVSGVPLMPTMSQRSVDRWKTREFVHRPSDVWVTSFPKSGTTWTQVIVLALLNQTLSCTSPVQLRRACPTYERRFGPDPEDFPNPRCLKTHWRNEEHMASAGRGRVVYISRRVVDSAYSYFHFDQMVTSDVGGPKRSLEDFEADFLNGDVPWGDYFDHYASWWKRRHDPNVYMLRYEALKEDRRKEIEGLAAFLGGTAPAQVDVAYHVSDFQEMKASETRCSRFWIVNVVSEYFRIKTTRVRSGKTGEGDLAFSPAFLQALEKKYTEVLEPLGVPREYIF